MDGNGNGDGKAKDAHDTVNNSENMQQETAALVISERSEQRHSKRHANWSDRKQLRKEKKAKKRKENPRPVVELDMSEEAVQLRREHQNVKREAYLMASEEGLHVVIDCGFEDEMNAREKKSLSQQIMFSYGVNRRCKAPMQATITSLSGETEKNLDKICGFREWLAFKATSKSYMEFFRKESLVYLTADSPNTITKLDRNDVYIIGGIVDRNRLKGVTYKKAVEQGIRTAKLPLEDCVAMGQSSRVLTVNHVFQILARFAETQDWTQAVLSTIPQRKGAEEKQS